MADSRSITVVPLKGANYPTWKIQCRMALMKEGLWRIVTGQETTPTGSDAERAKFAMRRDRALATIVLSVDTSLLYLIGEPEDPVVVWEKLAAQFEKKTWATRLDLRRKLHSLKLKDGHSAQEHIKTLTELFDALAVAGETVSEEDRVVYLLASLPESYNVLVTALEANEDVPKLPVVTERILHQERKANEKREASPSTEGALTTRRMPRRKQVKCYHCGRIGHIKKHCREYKAGNSSHFQKANPLTTREKICEDEAGLVHVASHALSASNSNKNCEWIIDSGATCHMCQNSKSFSTLYQLDEPVDVKLGDGRTLLAVGRGELVLDMSLPDGSCKPCVLHDVLYVPGLSYNLLSVSKASRNGKVLKFTHSSCYVLDRRHKLVAKASKIGSLYQLNFKPNHECANLVEKSETNEDIWHKRFGHLGIGGLQQLARENLVDGFSFIPNSKLSFCESCLQGKQHRTKFPKSMSRAKQPLDLVHSDLCGKLNEPSLSGAEYFVTFTDDKTRYVWVYFLKSKDQVFETFVAWKAMVERETGRKLKTLRTDNGGEYVSNDFQTYLRTEGVSHERTVPKNPQQNGVAERLNRTLIESTRSMLANGTIPHRFWAEALSTATYLHNRSPTRAVSKMTPYEAWTGNKPNVTNLRVFGCKAFSHVPKDERKGKLDSKTRNCLLLGYGTSTKGYRLYDPLKRKVFYSRDVVFNEQKFGLKQVTEPEVDDLVEIECPPESLDDAMSTAELPSISDSTVSDVTLRRSERVRTRPNFYGHACNVCDVEEPQSVQDALSKPEWKRAMITEIDSIHDNQVWDLVDLPKGRQPIGSRWVFKVKTNEDGSVQRCKARLVAQGYSQKEGLDYDQTFSPVVRPESVRSVVALSNQLGLKVHQMDITTAFLNGGLQEEVYMKQPKGFVTKGKEHLVCRLKKSLYGLKQSPRCWNQTLDRHLKHLGFKQSTSDPCIYTSASESDGFLILAVYVDDILLAGKSEKQIAQIKADLGKIFRLKDLGELKYFLGVNVQQRVQGTWIGQPAFTQAIIRKFGMEQCKPARTPISTGLKLHKAAEKTELFDAAVYQSAVGCLLYLSGWTRPDIAFAVSYVSRFCSNPSKEHWSAVKHILRYLKGTSTFGLVYSKKEKSLTGYSDADWAGDVNDRRSTSGYCFMLSGAAISWKSRKQSCVALSTAEAEYVALASATQEATWIRRLLVDLKYCGSEPTVIFEDNQSAICIGQNPQYHSKTKHIDIKYHFVRQQLSNKTIALQYCSTNDMIADVFTKSLSFDKFVRMRESLGLFEKSSVV